MALIRRGMPCALCRAPLLEGQPIFATSGVWLPPEDPLHRYCDAAMHWSCYAAWPQRPRFARVHVEAWVKGDDQDIWSAAVHLDDVVFVTRSLQSNRISVLLFETGTGHVVTVENWEAWLGGGVADAYAGLHPLLDAALAEARARLSRALPTVAAIEAAVSPRKRALVAEEWERGLRQQAEMKRYDDALDVMAEAAAREGLACPQCRVVRNDYKLSHKNREKRYLQCRRCGHRFGPDGPVLR
ncbi:hypothetical protein [Polyangium spumosum]|uniref:Uncharacterized protein n=1 Tax=Polyangium spumosum TaxID=889282 RepID=A0A6N7Q3I4_9BACT|nr:hypothetical protein [Polyangium spumosum]MRG98589.1 hypothetical protein [Polyangium spumosum]